jgi:hypothetical protein
MPLAYVNEFSPLARDGRRIGRRQGLDVVRVNSAQRKKVLMQIAAIVLMCAALVPAAAAAQPRTSDSGFDALATPGASIVVHEENGRKTSGRLLRLDAASLTIEVRGNEHTVEREHVARVYQQADSLKNGLWIGLGLGAALGIVTGAAATDCGFFVPQRCTGSDKAQIAAVLGGVLGAIGMGAGVGIDALAPHRRLLFEAHPRGGHAAFTVAPKLGPTKAGVRATVAW